jgi:hypothetical protein
VSGELLQFLVRTPVRPRGKIISGGQLRDLDGPAGGTCTVTLTKPDGSAGPASGAVGHVATGIYDFALDGPTDPTVYEITWAGQLGGEDVTVTTQAEALGEFLFSLPDLRDLRVGNGQPFKDSTAWPEERLLEARSATLDEFTLILGVSPVPRFAREVLDGNGRAQLPLGHRHASKLLTVTVDGTAQQLSGYTLHPAGKLAVTAGYRLAGAFPTGWQNVTVTYVHGWPRPFGDGGNIAMLRTAMRLDPSSVSGATSVVAPDGTSYSFDPAGQVTRAGQVRHFGVPVIDAWLNRWAYKASGRTLTYNPQRGALFHGGHA